MYQWCKVSFSNLNGCDWQHRHSNLRTHCGVSVVVAYDAIMLPTHTPGHKCKLECHSRVRQAWEELGFISNQRVWKLIAIAGSQYQLRYLERHASPLGAWEADSTNTSARALCSYLTESEASTPCSLSQHPKHVSASLDILLAPWFAHEGSGGECVL